MSRQAEVGSRSWRHKWGVWTMKTPTTCLEISKEKYVSWFGWQDEVGSRSWRHKWGVWTMRTATTCLEMLGCEFYFEKPLDPVWNWSVCDQGIFAISVLRMDNRTNTRPLHEAVQDQLIGWIIGLERVTSVLRLVQTLIVLLEWLTPLLEDVRMSPNQRDIIAMLKDNLMDLEAELQRQACEMREHILGRYHRALDGWDTSILNVVWDVWQA